MVKAVNEAGIGGPNEALRQTVVVMADKDLPSVPERIGDLAVQESEPELKRPPRYRVLMLNDDYTPMEFVVQVLQLFFSMNLEKATRTMLTVHTEGSAVCGIYTRDIAETKAAQVIRFARENEHPLLCEIEAVDDER